MSQEPPDDASDDPAVGGAPLGGAPPEEAASGESRTTLELDGAPYGGSAAAAGGPHGTATTAASGASDVHGAGDGARHQGARHRRRHRHGWIAEWAVIIVIALVAAFLVRTFVLETFYVPSTSMWPTLKAGDRIVVNKIYGTIHPGTIIVFKRPPAEDCGGPIVPDLVKRVIGLPGQTVSAKHGQVYITGKLLTEPWLPKGPHTYTSMTAPYTVPKGDYFVMGDNRINSCDSRTWGPVKSSYIVGKVFLIIWPPGRWRFF